MTRKEEIKQQAEECRQPSRDGGYRLSSRDVRNAFEEGAQWADKTMVDKACKCYCDDLCDKSRSGMCFHKYDGKYQIKESFKYNECHTLKLMRKAMLEEE